MSSVKEESKYPELDKAAKEVANSTLAKIHFTTSGLKSEMPYKAQYVLEEVLKILKDRV